MSSSFPLLEDLIRRAQAAFLGLAIGDALGATTEFLTPSEIRFRHKIHRRMIGGGWLNLKPGKVTDDTEMSLCIARAIDEAGGWNLRGIAEHFAGWLRSKPIDVGATCRRGISDFIVKGQLEKPYSDWDAGNGAAMRMLPVALFTLGDEDLLERYTLEQAHLTHNHHLSDAGCLAVGKLMHQALLGVKLPQLHTIVRDLGSQQPKFRCNHYRGEASAYVVETLQTVFHYFFSTGNFEECLIGVVNQGGDADTTGAIAGMIAGAFYAGEPMPRQWLKKLDPTIKVEGMILAERLVRLSPLGRKLQECRSAEC
jgi:ADP-ribosyl-[dinitrogen reductase] hydrolase